MTRRLAAVPAPQPHGVIYVRVSALMGRDSDAERFRSPSLQAEAVRRMFAQRGIVEAHEVISDLDVSGRGFRRDGLDRVLALVGSGEVNVVGVLDLSRLGRNVRGSLDVIARLRDLGATVISTVEQIDDSPEGQFLLTQFLGMAQLYSDQVSRRWKQVHRQRVEQGHHHGNPPAGYRWESGELVVDPERAEMVREIFTRYVAGESATAIGSSMRRRGAPAGLHQARRVLGRITYTGRVFIDDMVAQGRHEAIVDQQTWDAAQQRLLLDVGRPRRYACERHSLGGLVTCALCGYAMTFDASRAEQPVYGCNNGRRYAGCGGVGAPRVGDVEAEVLRQVREHLAALAAPRATVVRGVDTAGLRRRLARAEAALGSLAVSQARGEVVGGQAAYRAAAGHLEAERAELALSIARAELVGRQSTPEQASKLLDVADRVWAQMTFTERNDFLRGIVDRVVVGRRPHLGRSNPPPLRDYVTMVPLLASSE